MNIHTFLKNVKRLSGKGYLIYIVGVSVLCIMLSQFSAKSHFRSWVHRLLNKETINKSVEYEAGTEGDYGQFLTYYRYNSFDACNPDEVDVNAPMIALTFDDGPSEKATERILQVLRDNYSHATFFVVGKQSDKYPELIQSIASSGCEIGNHTYDHKNLTDLNAEEIGQQIDDVSRSVKSACGSDPTVIRPPYGAYDDEVMSLLDKPVILWDLDTEDWSSRNAQTVCDKVMAEVKDGDIVLMHDIYESTAEAVELLVPKLKQKGYQVVSVSELANYKGKQLELGTAYGKIKQ